MASVHERMWVCVCIYVDRGYWAALDAKSAFNFLLNVDKFVVLSEKKN